MEKHEKNKVNNNNNSFPYPLCPCTPMEIKIVDDPLPPAAITEAATDFSAGCKAHLPSHLIPKVPKASPRWDTSKWRWRQKRDSHDADTCPGGQAAAQGCVVLLLLWLICFCIPWLECVMK